MEKYFWTLDSFGSGPVPENWEEICSAANHEIHEFINQNPGTIDYCNSDKVGSVKSVWASETPKIIGQWWNDKSIDLVEQDGHVYALHGWNGEWYLDCWECVGDYHMDAKEERLTIRPIYRYEAENIDLDKIEENSAEWDSALEVVRYQIV